MINKKIKLGRSSASSEIAPKCSTNAVEIPVGFTLVEILVSISIMIVITAITLVNYRAGEGRTALNNAAQKMASDIRLAQQFALGEKEFKGQTPQAWGVCITSSGAYSYFSDTYYIFADLSPNNNHSCENGGSLDNNEIYAKVKLVGASSDDSDQENIYISGLTKEALGTSCSTSGSWIGMNFGINFESPKPDTHLIAESPCTHSIGCTYQKDLCIILTDRRNNATKKIRVNNVGLVDIID